MTSHGGGWTGKRQGRKPPQAKPAKPRNTPTTEGLPNALTPPTKKGRRRATTGQGNARTRAAEKQVHGKDGTYQSKLTREVIANLVQALASGLPPADAAPFAGISRASFHDYMSRGRMEGAEPIYVELVEQVERALSDWAVGMSAAATRVARAGDARALTFMLERRLPHAFGATQRVEHANADGEPFKMVTANFDASKLPLMTDEELSIVRQAAAIMQKYAGQGDVIDIATRRALPA